MGMCALFGHNLVKYQYFWIKPKLFDFYQYVTYCLWFITWVMLKCLIYGQKTLKMDKIGNIFCVFASTHFTKCVITFAFFNFFREVYRINAKLNFYYILLLRFLILVSRKIWRPNSKILPENYYCTMIS